MKHIVFFITQEDVQEVKQDGLLPVLFYSSITIRNCMNKWFFFEELRLDSLLELTLHKRTHCIKKWKMNHLILTGLFFLTLSREYLAMDCYHSETIKCTCSEKYLNCFGVQEEILEVQELLSNISTIYSTADLLHLVWNFENLMFPPNFTFSGLRLENISLSRGLENLDNGLFSGLEPMLISLNLQNNNLEQINNQTLSSLHNLKELNLDFNKFHEINNDMFFNLNQLEFLSISGNNLYRVEDHFLSNLPAINTLILNNNSIHSISDINIMSLSLRTLLIQSCLINGSLKNDSFVGVPNLEHADFSSNQLMGVDPYALSKINNLKRLNLSYNMLEYLKDNAFSALYKLESLDLKNNKLSFITENSFLNLTSLKYLDLSGNILQALLHTYTLDLYSLESINLQNNKIKIITTGTFSASPNLQEIFLEGNILECSCELSYFASYLVNNSHIKLGDTKSIRCASPSSVTGTELTKVNFTSLNCYHQDPVPDMLDYDEDYDYESNETSTKQIELTTELSVGTGNVFSETSRDISISETFSAPMFTGTSTYITLLPTIYENNLTEETISSETSFTSISTTEEIDSTVPLQYGRTSTLPDTSTENNISISTFSTTMEDKSTKDLRTSTQYIPFASSTEETTSQITLSATLIDTSSEATTSSKTNSEEYTENLGERTTTAFSEVIPAKKQELAIHILNFTSGQTFCVTWKINGKISNVKRCFLKIDSPSKEHGNVSEVRNLNCPISEKEILQCLDDTEKKIHGFCVQVLLNNMRKKQTCYKIVLPTSSTELTLESTETTQTIISTSIQPTKVSTNLTTIIKPQMTPKPSKNNSVPFKVVSFDVTFDYLKSSASVNWRVNREEPKSICSLQLTLLSYNFNRTRGVFNCANKSHVIQIKPEVNKVCLIISHNHQKNATLCKTSDPFYESKASTSTTKDPGYTNTALIAVICLLIIVLILIIIIAMKKLLKKRTESDRYNVSAEEGKVQKRISQHHREPNVRYSYTLKEQVEL